MAVALEPPRSRKGIGGRKTLLTPAIMDSIATAIAEIGLDYVQASILAGVAQSTALWWRQRAEGRHPIAPATPQLLEFLEKVEKAEAACEAEKLQIIQDAAKGGKVLWRKETTKPSGEVVVEEKRSEPAWQAAAWFLERTKPDRYARRERLDTRVPMQEKVSQIAAEQGMAPEAVMAEAQRLLVAEG